MWLLKLFTIIISNSLAIGTFYLLVKKLIPLQPRLIYTQKHLLIIVVIFLIIHNLKIIKAKTIDDF